MLCPVHDDRDIGVGSRIIPLTFLKGIKDTRALCRSTPLLNNQLGSLQRKKYLQTNKQTHRANVRLDI